MNERRVALITGAARRLGRDIALHLAGQGWDVCIHYRQSRVEAEATRQDAEQLGARAWSMGADLADEMQCRSLLPNLLEHTGRVDAVVNSASLFEYDDAATITHALMQRHWASNTLPAVILAQALADHVKTRQARGCVVNMLDQKLWNPNPDYLSYTLSKAALEAAGQLLARALAPHVRVVGVAPGVTLPSGPMNAAEFGQAHTMTPLGHSSTPGDIARAVAYLLDADAVTGTTLLVDGGQHMAAQGRDVMFMTGKA